MKCKKCKGEMIWVKRDGRWYGENPDGSDHWDTCSKNIWDQVKKSGERVTTKRKNGVTHVGFKTQSHGFQLESIHTPAVAGKNYKPSNCDCGIPPWEVCKHSFTE